MNCFKGCGNLYRLLNKKTGKVIFEADTMLECILEIKNDEHLDDYCIEEINKEENNV